MHDPCVLYSTACMTHVHCVTVAGTPAEYSPRDIPHSYFMKRRNATTITHQELIQDILALIQVDGARKKVSLKGSIASVLPPEKPSSTKRPKQRDPEIVIFLIIVASIHSCVYYGIYACVEYAAACVSVHTKAIEVSYALMLASRLRDYYMSACVYVYVCVRACVCVWVCVCVCVILSPQSQAKVSQTTTKTKKSTKAFVSGYDFVEE